MRLALILPRVQPEIYPAVAAVAVLRREAVARGGSRSHWAETRFRLVLPS